MFTLPTEPGDFSTLIERLDARGTGERIRVECCVGPRWLLHCEKVETVRDAFDEPVALGTPGGVLLDALSDANLDLAATAARMADRVTWQIIELQTKTSTAKPKRAPVKFARGRGWWAAIEIAGDADTCLVYALTFKRPLTAAELVVMTRALAKWIDARKDELH